MKYLVHGLIFYNQYANKDAIETFEAGSLRILARFDAIFATTGHFDL